MIKFFRLLTHNTKIKDPADPLGSACHKLVTTDLANRIKVLNLLLRKTKTNQPHLLFHRLGRRAQNTVLEKLIVGYLVEKLAIFYGIRKFITAFTTAATIR